MCYLAHKVLYAFTQEKVFLPDYNVTLPRIQMHVLCFWHTRPLIHCWRPLSNSQINASVLLIFIAIAVVKIIETSSQFLHDAISQMYPYLQPYILQLWHSCFSPLGCHPWRKAIHQKTWIIWQCFQYLGNSQSFTHMLGKVLRCWNTPPPPSPSPPPSPQLYWYWQTIWKSCRTSLPQTELTSKFWPSGLSKIQIACNFILFSHSCNQKLLVNESVMITVWNQDLPYWFFLKFFLIQQSIHTHTTDHRCMETGVYSEITHYYGLYYWHKVKHILKFWYKFSHTRNLANLFSVCLYLQNKGLF